LLDLAEEGPASDIGTNRQVRRRDVAIRQGETDCRRAFADVRAVSRRTFAAQRAGSTGTCDQGSAHRSEGVILLSHNTRAVCLGMRACGHRCLCLLLLELSRRSTPSWNGTTRRNRGNDNGGSATCGSGEAYDADTSVAQQLASPMRARFSRRVSRVSNRRNTATNSCLGGLRIGDSEPVAKHGNGSQPFAATSGEQNSLNTSIK
jgi:hypothetical protein